MILGFTQTFNNKKTLFKEKINAEIKIHSIREDKANRWCRGKIIHMATGVRTKYYDCFDKRICLETQKIQIVHSATGISVFIDNELYAYLPVDNSTCSEKDKNRLLILAHKDGFNSVVDFFKWFNTDFIGKIIHWTNFKY